MTTQLDIFTDYSRNDQAAVLNLIASDPLHAKDKAAIIEAIRCAVRSDGTVSGNEWRQHMPDVLPKLIGATVSQLVAKGVLTFHSWEQSTDTAGRNGGKMCRRYRWVAS